MASKIIFSPAQSTRLSKKRKNDQVEDEVRAEPRRHPNYSSYDADAYLISSDNVLFGVQLYQLQAASDT
ncbi:hypothetical protein IAT38_000804 [Cryptococcus sp. DSM 104549]